MSLHDLIRNHANELRLIDEALARFRSGNPDPVRDPISNEIYAVWADNALGVVQVSRGGKVVQRIKFTLGALSRGVDQGL
ncbi:hypothetical protein [Methylorubrum podarium]|jgi:hypothetical protein|uniref:hypothetical protein n=1 Tax=Methylorubrum podarium TaxID=200476 RepID=UPI001EE32874|nr:hypothetical protein [Methylorubrum podarium]